MNNLTELIEWIEEEIIKIDTNAQSEINYGELVSLKQCLIKATSLQSDDGWISVEDRLPTKEDADENGKILVWREVESTQKLMSKSIYDYAMAKYLDKSSFWQPLPNNPQQLKEK